MSDDSTLTIDVVSDVVCPWCYLGEKRLAAALADETAPVVVRWRPFQHRVMGHCGGGSSEEAG